MARSKVVYKITYPNGKIYVGMDLTGTLQHPVRQLQGRLEHRFDDRGPDETQTGGRLLVGAIGLAIIVVGVVLVVRGIKASFTHHLQPQATSSQSGNVIVRLGQAGYVAKGVSLGIVGGLFVLAAWTCDPQKAGGLDTALQTLLDQPLGPYVPAHARRARHRRFRRVLLRLGTLPPRVGRGRPTDRG